MISRTSSATFKGTTKDARTIARELGTRFLLEGSVRRADSRLRITAQLIDAEADTHLWAEKYDGYCRRRVRDSGADRARDRRGARASALGGRGSASRPTRHRQRPRVRVLSSRSAAGMALAEGRDRSSDSAPAQRTRARRRQRASSRRTRRRLSPVPRSGDRFWRRAARRGGGVRAKSVRARARIGGRLAIARMDSLLAGAHSGGCSRSQIGARAGAERSGHAAVAEQLLSDLRPSAGRASVARPADLDRPVDAVDALHAGVCCAPRRRPRGERLGRIERCSRWTPAIRWRGCFTCGCCCSIAAWTPPRQFSSRFLPRFATRCRRESRRSSRRRSPRMAATVGFHRSRRTWKRRRMQPMYSRGCWLKPTRLPELSAPSIHWIEVAIERGFINHPFLARWDPFLEGLRNEPRFVALMEVVRKRWMRFES